MALAERKPFRKLLLFPVVSAVVLMSLVSMESRAEKTGHVKVLVLVFGRGR